jgi:hypothetical protein
MIKHIKHNIYEGIGEKLFIAWGIILLPIWFPLLCLWVITDPPYRILRIQFLRKRQVY